MKNTIIRDQNIFLQSDLDSAMLKGRRGVGVDAFQEDLSKESFATSICASSKQKKTNTRKTLNCYANNNNKKSFL